MTAKRMLIALFVVTTVVLTSGPAGATSQHKCLNSKRFGTTCTRVFGNGLSVADITVEFTTPTSHYFQGKTWAVELTAYRCDPRGKTKARCTPNALYYSRTRHGDATVGGTNCRGAPVTSDPAHAQQCQPYGVVSAVAAFGDWPGYQVPFRYGDNSWLCVEMATRGSTGWVDNGLPGPAPTGKGYRSCQRVHP